MARRHPVHRLITQAKLEAYAAGLPTVEAEHLLLAISRQGGTPAGRLLNEAGLDHDAIAAVLQQEFSRSLEAAGVRGDAFARLSGAGQVSRRSWLQPRLAESTRLAFHRCLRSLDGPRSLTELHVLAGVLRAEVGTVPRALAFAGIDRSALLTRTQEAIATTG